MVMKLRLDALERVHLRRALRRQLSYHDNSLARAVHREDAELAHRVVEERAVVERLLRRVQRLRDGD